jgi:hypothetical protein
VTFERFDGRARLTVVLAQEECRLLGHGDIGADHLLVAVARADEAILALAPERLRAVVVRLRGPREGRESPPELRFTAEAMAALQTARDHAATTGHTEIRPGHVLLALLAAGPTAARILGEVGIAVPAARSAAEHAAAHPPTPAAAPPPLADPPPSRVPALDEGRFEDAIRDGRPVMVRLHNAPPLGDIGHPLVDARLLRVMLAADGRVARMLRAHGVDEAALDAALEPPGDT